MIVNFSRRSYVLWKHCIDFIIGKLSIREFGFSPVRIMGLICEFKLVTLLALRMIRAHGLESLQR